MGFCLENTFEHFIKVCCHGYNNNHMQASSQVPNLLLTYLLIENISPHFV